MKTTIRTAAILAASSLLGAAAVACAPVDDSSTTDPVATDTYASAIPSADMLSLQQDEEGGEVSQGLRVEQAALGEPSMIRERARRLRQGLDTLKAETHERIQTLVETGEVTEFERDRLRCKRWEADGPNNSWKLVACKVDARAERVAWTVEGKPLDSGDEAWLVTFAGKGRKLESHQGRRRGAGVAGYNFDNIAALTGRPVAGKLAIGYRAQGPARQLNVGMKGLVGPNMEEPHSARYRFRHVRGEGGAFRFATGADLVTLGDDGEPTRGEDGTREFLRAGVAWNGEGQARTAAIICGGTLGERCIHKHQCWEREGALTFEEESDRPVAPNWEPTACAPVPEDVDAPAEDDVSEPDDAEGEADAPAVEEPEPYQTEG